MSALELNHRLATLLGWSNLKDVGGALLGTPPAGAPQCRNEAKVPNWAGDWRDCGPLIAEHHMQLEAPASCVEAKAIHGPWVEESMGDISRDECTRRAIVLAVITKLEAGR
jgi:hypothetical protein